MAQYLFTCDFCGESFQASRKDAKTCSARCRYARRYRQQRDAVREAAYLRAVLAEALAR